jgi:nicotinate-nucleotide adenylyltransferase
LKIGLFGGTFDPPHLGHLILAEEAQAQLGLDRLMWLLTPDPPHKRHRSLTPIGDRLAMLQSAIHDNPSFELSRVDLERPAPHYAVDTVRLVATANPDAAVTYLMGGDSLRDLPTWHRPADFVAACDRIGVMRRVGDEIDMETLQAVIPGLREKVSFLTVPRIEIASSDIRFRAANGRPYRYYLPPPVYEYIRIHNLYIVN